LDVRNGLFDRWIDNNHRFTKLKMMKRLLLCLYLLHAACSELYPIADYWKMKSAGQFENVVPSAASGIDVPVRFCGDALLMPSREMAEVKDSLRAVSCWTVDDVFSIYDSHTHTLTHSNSVLQNPVQHYSLAFLIEF
jgi:hypothetical protein